MKAKKLLEMLEDYPLITAVRSDDDLEMALHSEPKVCFVLYGTVATIPRIVKRLKEKKKVVFVHDGLIEGLSTTSPAGVSYLQDPVGAHGIITTRASNANRAKELGLFVVFRYFLLDSLSLSNMKSSLKHLRADAIEILPGVIPKLLEEVKEICSLPVIAGGLIREKTEVMAMLRAGAIAVSTSASKLWDQ